LARGENHDRKFVDLKQEVGLDLRLTSSSSNNFEVETPDPSLDDDLKQGVWRRRELDKREWENVFEATGVKTGL
jgi:hypothetical protein